MRRLLGEHGMMLVAMTVTIIIMTFFFGSFLTNDAEVGLGQVVPDVQEYQKEHGNNDSLDTFTPQPVLTLRSGTIDLDSTFNVSDFIVTATDEKGTNLIGTSQISYRGEVDTTNRGNYNIEIIMKTDNFVLTRYTTVIVD